MQFEKSAQGGKFLQKKLATRAADFLKINKSAPNKQNG